MTERLATRRWDTYNTSHPQVNPVAHAILIPRASNPMQVANHVAEWARARTRAHNRTTLAHLDLPVVH
eukprot:356995-Chlamydomonas_euryale.AAC.20